LSAISLDKARLHTVLTPEGLSLPFVVAPAGDRAGAFLIDLVLITISLIGVGLLASFGASTGLGEVGVSFAFVAGFLISNFYFIFFEVHRGGVTPGKRRTGIRVISRDGGPLTAEAVIARNLLRNLEVTLPAMVLLAPDQTLADVPGWGRLAAAVWLLVLALMPLLNRDRLRCGDLVAGTLVVKAPVAVLLSDLAARDPQPRPPRRHPAAAQLPVQPPAPEEEFPFTREQLDIYGVHELQVLEDLLRRDDQGTLDGPVLVEVAEKIKLKIGWPRERWQVPARRFLEAFYRAQRGLLEQKLLFGERRERKRG
jgi:uncharacterized RDD family membrane protein YckC